MMKFLSLLVLVIMFAFGGVATAEISNPDGLQISKALMSPVPRQAHQSEGRIIRVHDGWRFIGCIPSESLCHRHAHEHGYFGWRLEHDHDRCPESPGYACYGR